MNQKSELYNLCDGEYQESNYVCVLGWISNDEFLVWIPYLWIDDFMHELIRIFGNSILGCKGINANMQLDGVCIDLCKAVGCNLNLEDVFPKDKYKCVLG